MVKPFTMEFAAARPLPSQTGAATRSDQMGPPQMLLRTRCAQRDRAPVDSDAKDFDLLVLFRRNVGGLRARGARDGVGSHGGFQLAHADTHVSRIRAKGSGDAVPR
jgi:hypothetical protein